MTGFCLSRTPQERPLWRGQQTAVAVRLVLRAKGRPGHSTGYGYVIADETVEDDLGLVDTF
jgi:hypothetical protein